MFSICIMGYTIEISNDVRKPNKLLKNMQERRQMAEDHMCEMQYFMHEIEGKKRTIIRNDSIQVVIFNSEQFENLLNFIVNIRKTKSFYIECIYRDDNISTNDLLFVSPKYLQRMDRNLARTLKREMKNKESDDTERIAIKEALST